MTVSRPIAALLAFAITFGMIGVLAAPLPIQPPVKQYRYAPVFQPNGGNVWKQTGWFKYEREDGVIVLFCVRKPEQKSQVCAAFVVEGNEGKLVTVEGVKPSEENV